MKSPETRKSDHVDVYHGTRVPDPYRWLEDDTSTETAAWVAAQNGVTQPYLQQIPFRAELQARVLQLNDYEKYSAPSRKGPWFFFARNSGLQNQSVLFVQRGLEGAPEVLLDPNTWSADGTIVLSMFVPSTDARYAVYGRSTSGSDWQTFKILEIASKTTLTDEINWVKVSGVAWYRDGFFYSRYPVPPAGQEKATINENHQVFFHRLGTAQSDDVLVFEDAQNPQRFHTLQTTEDERFAILTVSDRGKGKDGNALYVADLQPEGGSATPWPPRFEPLVPAIEDDSFVVVDNVGGELLVQTNRAAPNWRVVRIDPARPDEANWVEVLPERSEPLQSANTAGGKLFAMYLQDVASRAYVFTLDGALENEIVLPGPGAAGGLGGSKDDEFVFYTFNSLSVPPTIFRYDIATRTSAVFRESRVPGYDPSAFETSQVFYPEQGRDADSDVPGAQEGHRARRQ